MTQDRITQIRVAGLRSLADVTLDLSPMTVLIGENGAGKSSILEALELIRWAGTPVAHLNDILLKRHGGETLFRIGTTDLSVEVTIGPTSPIKYGFTVSLVGSRLVITEEHVDWFQDPGKAGPLHALRRRGGQVRIYDVREKKLTTAPVGPESLLELLRSAGKEVGVGEQALALPWLGVDAQPIFGRVCSALNRISCHVAFETRPVWLQRELELRRGPRWPSEVEPTERLARFGVNLPNVFQELRNRTTQEWQRIIDVCTLALGDDLRNFVLAPAGRGNVELQVLFGSLPKPIPVEALSDGQLSYLCFVALTELDEGRSLLSFDEPELHLHPAILARVAWMLEEASERAPVIVATHSDRFLDALENPAQSVVLCELNEERATVLRRPNAEALAAWMEQYGGIGSIRAQGLEAHVFDRGSEEGKK